MLCTDCGGENGRDHRFCVHCGISLRAAPSTPQVRRERSTVKEKPHSDPDQKTAPISAAVIIGLFAVIFILTGADLRTIPALLLLFFPLIVGEVVFLRRSEKPVAMVKGFEAWVSARSEINSARGGRICTSFVRPLFLCATKVLQSTEGVENHI